MHRLFREKSAAKMNTDAGRKDPTVVSKIIDMVEGGISPENIGKALEEEAELKAIEAVEGPKEDEKFADEIKIIAQALAYREAVPEDLSEIMKLLQASYKVELEGEEAFRTGEAVSVEVVISLFEDKSYTWLVCEAPNGREVENDGVILGVSIFSTGKSKSKSKIEGCTSLYWWYPISCGGMVHQTALAFFYYTLQYH